MSAEESYLDRWHKLYGACQPDPDPEPCQHGVAYCWFGCHDDVPYEPEPAGLTLVMELVEFWANTGALDSFHGEIDQRTGHDGLDELIYDLFHNPDLLS